MQGLKFIRRTSNSFRFAVFTFFFLTIGFVFVTQLPTVKGKVEEEKVRSIESITYGVTKRENPLLKTQFSSLTLLPDQTPETHTLSATYYRINSNFESVLMVSNQGPNPMPVRVSLFNLSGEQFDLPLVVLNGKEVKAFNLRNYIQSPNFNEGSLQVTYEGKRLELGGVVQNVDANRSLMFDEELSETKYFASTKLEGVWWTKWTAVNMSLAVYNTTSYPITANVAITGTSPNQINPKTIFLQPHQTRVFDIDEIVGLNNSSLSTVGGISISHNGLKGGILARGLIFNTQNGYSNVIEFSDPAKPKSTKIDGVGLRIGAINGQPLTQGIVARNVGDTRVRLKGYLSYKKQNSSGEIVIPDVWLNAGEVKEINISALLSSNNITNALASGLHFEHNGLPGKVLVSAQSVSQDGNNIFRVPFRDSRLSSSTGTYPWSLDGDSKAIVYLQNVTDATRKYTVQIDYEGGSYVLGVKTLQARQVIAYDIRKIRDEQTPDINGNTIPPTATAGKAYWSVNGTGSRDIIGRIEQADLVNGLSSTSACGRCCPNSIIDARLEPYSVVGFIGDTNPFIAIEYDVDCYGNPLYPFPTEYNVSFSSSDTSVATINSTGLATGVGVGTTTISGLVEGIYYTNCTAEDAGDEYCCDEANAPTYCDASCDIRPRVTINVPKAALDGDTVEFSVSVEDGTPTSYQWSFEPTSGGNNPQVNFTNPTTATTMAKAHWFAKPDIPCPSLNSKYTIKVKVTFQNGSPITEQAPFTVSVGTNWGGQALAPTTLAPAGTLDTAYDISRGVWVIVGRGSLTRVLSPIMMRTPETSQFYNKTRRHEQVHEQQYTGDGIYSDLYQIDDVMPRLYQLSNSNKQVLEQMAFEAVEGWRREQDIILRQRLPQAEMEAYAVSDLIAPRYVFQEQCPR